MQSFFFFFLGGGVHTHPLAALPPSTILCTYMKHMDKFCWNGKILENIPEDLCSYGKQAHSEY